MKRSVLVANADGAMSHLEDRCFSNAGYRIETVRDGLACMNRMRQGLPDLLLLDQELPWGGGDGVLACLREETAFARVPVVLVADVLPIQDLSRLLVRPVIRCLQKRCRVEILRYCIDSALALRESAVRRFERPKVCALHSAIYDAAPRGDSGGRRVG